MPAEVFPSVRILRSSASVLRTTSERDTRSGPRSPPRASSPWHDAHAVSKAALASMRLTAFVLDAVLPGLFCALRRSEEHTSELQSRLHLVCRLLLEKKKNTRRLDMACSKCVRPFVLYLRCWSSYSLASYRTNI